MNDVIKSLQINYLRETNLKIKNQILSEIYSNYLANNKLFLAYLCACRLYVANDSPFITCTSQENYETYTKIDQHKVKLLENECAVSVIVPTFNRPSELKVCIDSILRQQFEDYEIIIVNDCGCDDAEAVVLSFGSDRIKYIKLHVNKGLPGARNEGILRASGEYIAYLDDDDIYYDNHLQTVVGYLENNPGVDAAYADAWWCYGQFKDNVFKESRRENFSNRPTSFDRNRLFESNYISTLNIVHKKKCFYKTGLFNEELPKLEDWDFLLRLAKYYSIVQLNEKTGEYRWKDNNMSLIENHEMNFMLRLLRSYYDLDSGRLLRAHYLKVNGHIDEYNAMITVMARELESGYFIPIKGIARLIETINSTNSFKFRRIINEYFEYDAGKCLKKLYSCHLYPEIIRLLFGKKTIGKIIQRINSELKLQ